MMEYFELEILIKNKLIQVKGQIGAAQKQFAEFLKKLSEQQRNKRSSFTHSLMQKINYTGDELLINILFSIIIIICQIYNAIQQSNDFLYEVCIIGTIIYAFIFRCVVNCGKPLFIQLLFCLLGLALFVTTLIFDVFDKKLAGMILACLVLVFIGKAAAKLQNLVYSQDIQAGFVFQSNLIVFIYLAWKGYQLILANVGSLSFNYYNLFASIFALSIINGIKTYHLFNFDLIHVLKIFRNKNSKKRVEDENKKQNNNKISDKDKSQLNSGEQNIIQKQHQQDNNKQIKSFYQIFGSILVFLIGFIHVIYIISRSKDWSTSQINSSLYLCFIANIRNCCLLMLCDFQKTISNQSKGVILYISLVFFELILMLFSASFMYFSNQIGSNNKIVVLLISPYLVMKIFSFLNQKNHQNISNGSLVFMVIFFIVPLSFQQIAILQDIQILRIILISIIALYSIFILVIMSHKEQFLTLLKQIKVALGKKNYKFDFLQKIKNANFNYNEIAQSNLYFHHIIMVSIYYFCDTSLLSDNTLLISYFIIYFSPFYLYVSSLFLSYEIENNHIETYYISIHNIISLALSISYVIISRLNILSDSSHQVWSLNLLFVIFLAIATIQGEKLLYLNFKAYSNFIRTLSLNLFYILIFHPFVGIFVAFYYLLNFNSSYLFYYCISGFVYIWAIITFIGVVIHWVLNLTEKSKKDLFIAQYMENQMKSISMKQDSQKILMIANMYEFMNKSSQQLLIYLKSQKHLLVTIQDDKDIEYDYQLIEPDDPLAHRKIQIKAKYVNPFELIGLIYQPNQGEQQKDNKQDENPVLSFFNGKQRNKIEILLPKDKNDNIVELKRMLAKQKEIKKTSNKIQIQKSDIYKEMISKGTQENYGNIMNRLFYFLSQPGENISLQSFSLFLQLLTNQDRQKVETTNKVYQNFGQGRQISQGKFKKFIVDFVQYKYQMKNEPLSSIIKTFCCRQLVALLLLEHQKFKYFLNRKKLSFNTEKVRIWIDCSNNIQQSVQAYQGFLQKQLKMKARLLHHKKDSNKKNGQEDDQAALQQQIQLQNQKKKSKKIKILNKKDKQFKKIETIYAILVNSLVQCYISYEHEAENFKITSIKFTLSNLLAIVTKISDFVFVFGYSSVYLLIAYFKEDYSSSSYVLSSISYIILIILAGVLVLVYVIFIIYHKKDFENGTLGLDDQLRTLDFKSIKFYTTTILFLLGSGLANYIIGIGLNSFICDKQNDKLFNFHSTSCYTEQHYIYMVISLLILIIYWPLSAITFPFSTAMDRNLQIKYKSEYQIIYLQCKFIINGYNTILNPLDFQYEAFAGSVLKVLVCGVLAISFHRMKPCSFELMNLIEGKIYIVLTIITFAGMLCYFVGFIYSSIITGGCLLLYLIYFIYITIKSYSQLYNRNDNNDQVFQDNLKNQNLKKEIIRKCGADINHTQKTQKQQNKVSNKKTSGKNFLQVLFSVDKNQQSDEMTESQIKLKHQEKLQNLSIKDQKMLNLTNKFSILTKE